MDRLTRPASKEVLMPTVRSASRVRAHLPATDVSCLRRRRRELEEAIRRDPAAFRIVTGDRPTGPLHLGHYFGTLLNRVRLQNLGVDLLVLIADYQAITDRDALGSLPPLVEEQVADYLAVGIDPSRATIFAHSQIEAIGQLFLPLLSLVSVAEVGRNPTVKEEVATSGRSNTSALMFTYPVHQAADILSCQANLVPVGRDQLPHIELTRLIARRFNERYSPDRPLFAVPDALLGEVPILGGLDGQKMSKSRRNAIPLSASEDETALLIRGAVTDGERTITYDPVHRPAVSNLVLMAALCLERPPEEIAVELGGAGSAALKRLVTEAVNERLRPIRAQRQALVRDRAYLQDVLAQGNERARVLACSTLDEVRRLMHMRYQTLP